MQSPIIQANGGKNQVFGDNSGSVGDKNYYGLVNQRHLSTNDYSYILRTIPLSTSKIEVNGVGQSEEAQNFRNEICAKLSDLGYKNLEVNLNTIDVSITNNGVSNIVTNNGEFKIIDNRGVYEIDIYDINNIIH